MAGATEWTDAQRFWLAHYPPNVAHHVSIPEVSLHGLVARAVRAHPDHTALVYYGRRYSYEEFWREAGRFAEQLRSDGIRPGDRVALYLPNSPLYPIALFGILRTGAIAVQISPLYLGDDLVTLLRDSEPWAIVTLEILYPNLARSRAQYRIPRAYVARFRDFYPGFARPFVNRVLRRHGRSTDFPTDPEVVPWTTVRRRDGRSFADAAVDPATAVAVLQYTGGTTGTAKAAMLSHRNLIANVVQANTWNVRRRAGDEIILTAIPLFHIYGLTVGLLLGLTEGDTVVLQTQPNVPELLKLIRRYRPTQFPGVPALYGGLLRDPRTKQYDLRSIRFCLSGSAPLPAEVQKQFEALTGAALIEGYGLSETSPATHANPVEGDRRAGSIGLPLPDTDEKIVDLEAGTRELPIGEEGELAVRGPQVMLGYYRRPSETALVLQNGWFRTGDVARLDADGFAYIVDRIKDMINVGGMKVWPREVEEVLFQHPAVQEAAVVGAPDPDLGEVVKAYVVLKPGATATGADLTAFVRARLAHFKAPRSVEFLDALPRTGVQKVLRRVLRAPTAPAPASGPAPTRPD